MLFFLPWHWFWIQGCNDSKIFSYAVQNEARDPQIVSDCDIHAWTYLVLPLSRHDFSVRSTDLYTSVQTSTIMRINNVTCDYFITSDATVIGSIIRWPFSDSITILKVLITLEVPGTRSWAIPKVCHHCQAEYIPVQFQKTRLPRQPDEWIQRRFSKLWVHWINFDKPFVQLHCRPCDCSKPLEFHRICMFHTCDKFNEITIIIN